MVCLGGLVYEFSDLFPVCFGESVGNGIGDAGVLSFEVFGLAELYCAFVLVSMAGESV